MIGVLVAQDHLVGCLLLRRDLLVAAYGVKVFPEVVVLHQSEQRSASFWSEPRVPIAGASLGDVLVEPLLPILKRRRGIQALQRPTGRGVAHISMVTATERRQVTMSVCFWHGRGR